MKFILILTVLSAFLWCGNSVSLMQKITEKDGPILKKGWLKFFDFQVAGDGSEKPGKFEINSAYQSQFAYSKNVTFTDDDKDASGWFDIPSNSHFFFVLTEKSFYSLTSRRNDMVQTHNVLEISWLKEEREYNG